MLSKLQKQKLVMVARKAYDAMNPKPLTQPSPREGRGNDTVPVLNLKPLTQPSPREGRGNDFDNWRHAEVAKACGKAGLRCCENHDYPIVMAHFLKLAGEDGQALNWLLRAQSDGRRQAEAVLHREIIKRGCL
jgi:hypothetical protein